MDTEFWGNESAVSEVVATNSGNHNMATNGVNASSTNPSLTPMSASVLQPNGPIYDQNLLQTSPAQQLYYAQQQQQEQAMQQQQAMQSMQQAMQQQQQAMQQQRQQATQQTACLPTDAMANQNAEQNAFLQQQQQPHPQQMKNNMYAPTYVFSSTPTLPPLTTSAHGAAYNTPNAASSTSSQFSALAPTSRNGIGMRARDIKNDAIIQVDTGPLHHNPLDANRAITQLTNGHVQAQPVASPPSTAGVIPALLQQPLPQPQRGEGVFVPVGQRPIEIGDAFASASSSLQMSEGDASSYMNADTLPQQDEQRFVAPTEESKETDKSTRNNANSRKRQQTTQQGRINRTKNTQKQQTERRKRPLLQEELSVTNENGGEVCESCDDEKRAGSSTVPWTIVIVSGLVVILLAAVVAALVWQRRQAQASTTKRDTETVLQKTSDGKKPAGEKGTLTTSKSVSAAKASRSKTRTADSARFIPASIAARQNIDQVLANDDTTE